MTEQGQAVGIDSQGEEVLKEESSKVFEMVPGCVGGNEGGPHELTGMIIDGEQEGLFLRSLPPLMDGRVVLPELVDARSFPSASSLGVAGGQACQVGKAVARKRGHGLTMSLEAKAGLEFVGDELKVRRALEREEALEELRDLFRPNGPVITA